MTLLALSIKSIYYAIARLHEAVLGQQAGRQRDKTNCLTPLFCTYMCRVNIYNQTYCSGKALKVWTPVCYHDLSARWAPLPWQPDHLLPSSQAYPI